VDGEHHATPPIDGFKIIIISAISSRVFRNAVRITTMRNIMLHEKGSVKTKI
jgi:hypothetical protein